MWSDKDLRKNNLDVMRFAMAVLVIFSHSFTLLRGTTDDTEPLRRLNHNVLSLGDLAVDVFFIISGFLITMSWQRSKKALTYLRKRAGRIVPGYLVATLVGVFLVGPFFVAPGQNWHTPSFFKSLFAAIVTLRETKILDVFPNNPFPGALNGSLWTISYEFLCYLFVIVFGLLGLIRYRWASVCVLLLLMLVDPRVILKMGHAPDHLLTEASIFSRLAACFLAGAVFYLYRSVIPFNNLIALGCAIAASVAAITGVALAFLPLFLTYVVFWLGFQPYLRAEKFASHGDFSYGIYLYAFLIQQVLIAKFQQSLNPCTLFIAATALSIIAGFLSWHVVEKFFVGRKVQSRPIVLTTPQEPRPQPELVSRL